MAKYRKKPVTIDAVQMPTQAGDFHAAPPWVVSALDEGTVWYSGTDTFRVKTLEGVMDGKAGDFLIRGIKGELYPCRADIFAATYERAEG